MDPKKMEEAMKQIREKMAEAKHAENKVEIVADAVRDMIVNMGITIPDKAFDIIGKIKIPANPAAATTVTSTKPAVPAAPVATAKPAVPTLPITVTKPATPVPRLRRPNLQFPLRRSL
ncbi:hypothetical protein GTO91_14190 [Heliobacterium undosum]|uniref:Uncharacterized protein n=1 Tax=Heliomicrobium undosum TaxID=121734 RepID=A0A845L752_9FIRM|nr:hypothetical protein [Heliomicrobium undosum]MZP30865.1 hypothetical protein [Heliomicrobium undosum]